MCPATATMDGMEMGAFSIKPYPWFGRGSEISEPVIAKRRRASLATAVQNRLLFAGGFRSAGNLFRVRRQSESGDGAFGGLGVYDNPAGYRKAVSRFACHRSPKSPAVCGWLPKCGEPFWIAPTKRKRRRRFRMAVISSGALRHSPATAPGSGKNARCLSNRCRP